MSNRLSTSLRREAAPLFLLAALVAPVVAALAWGRLGAREEMTASPSTAGARALAEAELGARGLTLHDADRSALMRLLWQALDALKASEPLPAPDGAPQACRRLTRASLFVTLYAPGRARLRAMAREPSLAQSTLVAARRLVEAPGFYARGFHKSEGLRARFDIITQEQDLPPFQCEQFAVLELAAPVGLALWRGDEPQVFLPGDLADYRAGTHLDMLRTLCQDAGLAPTEWKSEKHRLTLVRTQSFVSAGPGTEQCLELVRGLPRVRAVGLAQARRSCRMAATYIARSQGQDGWFAELYDAGTGAVSGRADVRLEARAATALSRFCALQDPEGEECLACASRAMAVLWNEVRVPPLQPGLAFVAPEGEGPSQSALADTAAVLAALCEYECACADETWDADDLIDRLARFLMLLQDSDGAFRTGGEPDSAEAPEADAPELDEAAQAEAAQALALAYVASREPALLLAARKALDRLSMNTQALAEPEVGCSYVAAVEALSRTLPVDNYMPAVQQALEPLVASRISQKHAPAPDLLGGTLRGFPPPVGSTAAELKALAQGWLLGGLCGDQYPGELRRQAAAAALSAARYVVHFQFSPENSYYLVDPDRALGGVRREPGSNKVELASVVDALEGLGALTQAMTLELEANDDSQSED